MSRHEWDRDYSSYAEFYQHAYGQHITGMHRFGTAGASAIEAIQSAGDWSDAPTPEFAIAWLPSTPVGFTCDLGAGRFAGTQQRSDAILIAPGAGSSIQMHGAHVCRLISVPWAWITSLPGGDDERLPADGDFGALHGRLLRHSELRRVLDCAWREADTGARHGVLYTDGLLLQLLGLLCNLRTRKDVPEKVSRGGLAPWQERRCTEYLRDNMDEDVDLATLAGVAQLSPFHFARMFKKSLGVPPHRYQLLLRLERAKALLVETEMSVLQIALAVGYESPQTLARLFQRELGVTPSAYRRERK